jgi:hypothetical protein
MTPIPELVLSDRVTIYDAPELDDEGHLTCGTTVLGTAVYALVAPLDSEQAATIVGELGVVAVRVLLLPGQQVEMNGRLVIESAAAFPAGTEFLIRSPAEAIAGPPGETVHHQEVIAIQEQA